jgi:predicted O-methyltransferase YrrM
VNKHIETRCNIDELGKRSFPYEPTYPIKTPINDFHNYFTSCDKDGPKILMNNDAGENLPGMLRREDAMKIYELALKTTGDILELGCFRGLSTFIITKAILHSSPDKKLTTVDLSADHIKSAKYNISTIDRDVNENPDLLETIVSDAGAAITKLVANGRKFTFAFIDHSHAYKHVLDVCQKLDDVIEPGGFCLFHDYNDKRNSDERHTDYGVYQGVRDGLSDDVFDFYGCYGCTGLYRKKAE